MRVMGCLLLENGNAGWGDSTVKNIFMLLLSVVRGRLEGK